MRERGVRKKLNGVVVGTGMEKTAVVLVNRLKKHKTYSKYIKRHSKYLVHDPKNRCQVGDKVKIIESRPISKSKRWQLIEIIEKGEMGNLENSIDKALE
ncbi:30S ribosomal protein S17 [Deltaproteobacteria bacterium]|nr:30S ribosomal protein S17 [Deltaproteobacteria bacterium]